MKLLILDTETTGLPKSRNSSIYSTDEWPHVIQLSYIVIDTGLHPDDKYIITDKVNTYIKIKFPIPQDSIAIHGITDNILNTNGVDIINVINILNNTINNCDLIIGHNISFDKQVLIVENIRNKIISSFSKKPSVCTMKMYKQICNINIIKDSKSYLKYPTLQELHQYTFNENITNLHNSYVDVLICARCYFKLNYDVDLLMTNSEFSTEYYTHISSSIV
jgi:DNA polymerase III epsilon subunit-like protein